MSHSAFVSSPSCHPNRRGPRRPPAILLGLGLALLGLGLAGCGAALPVSPVVTIAPAAVTLQAGGGSQQFTATVLNATDKSVVWRVNGVLGGNAAAGTISQGGMYQAPQAAPAAGTVTVEAVSVANDNSQASAVVTLGAAVSVAVTPATAMLAAGASQQFNAAVANASDTSVVWSVNGTVGGSDATGTISTAGLYTAPASFPGLAQVTIAARSVQDPDMSGSATVSLAQSVSVTVAPAAANVNLGATQSFVATVGGTADLAVVWSVDGVAGGSAALGTVDAGGNFTAPATMPSPAQETITATSHADPTRSGAATVTITAPVGITLTPASASLAANATQQFTATVNNAQDTSVRWSVNGVAGGNAQFGLITANGLYTAPAAFPGLSRVTVGVVAVADPSKSASATVTLVAPVTVAVSPSTASVGLGLQQKFVATVGGTTNQAVNWSVNTTPGGSAALGTIDASGNYTAPAALPTPATVTIVATSVQDPTQSGSAQVTLVAPVGITIDPATASLEGGATQQFTATLSRATNLGIVWSVNGTVGGSAASGTISTSGLYTAPAVIAAAAQVAVSAASAQDPSKSASATVSLVPVGVTVTPASANVLLGQTQKFAAALTGTANQAVNWSVNTTPGGSATLGTIDASGLYTAPAALPTPATVTIVATSQQDPKQSGSAQVTLQAPVGITIDPTTASLQGGATQQFSATLTHATDPGLTWTVNGTVGGSAASGTISTAGLYTAPALVAAAAQVTVMVASVQDPTKTASAVVSLVPVGVTVAPATASVLLGQTQTFTATVTGTANPAVNWSVNTTPGGSATLGTIDATGVYTAPATLPTPTTVTIVATSQQDPKQSGSAQVTLQAPVGITINPTTASLESGATQQFTATLTHATDPGLTWSVNGTVGGGAASGTISTTGLYTAPATVTDPAQVTVMVASVQDPTKTASAVVSLKPPITVTVTPATATVNLGAKQVFAAAVTGTATTGVNWSVNGVAGGNATLGTIAADGTFTAPKTLPSPALETVTATSQADATKSGSAQVTVQTPPQAFTLTPGNATLSLGKAESGSQSFQLALAAGFTTPVQLTVSGEPVNVTATVNPTTLSASGAVQVTLTTASISLAQTGVPITLTATSTDASGNPIVQTATVQLTITGWAGHVSTVAGGPGGVGFEDGTGPADELQPLALVSDGGQNVYFADKRGTALRTYGLTSQTVTTVAGGPYNYSLGEGDGMVYDPDNQTVYVADALRNRIDSYAPGAYTLSVLAGGGPGNASDGVQTAASFAYPHGLAITPDHTTLYVADTDDHLIRKIVIATGAVTTVAGQVGHNRSTDGVGTNATFCQPTGLGIDASGANLYVTDQCGDVVRQIALPSYTVTTVAGSGQPGQTDGPAATATFSAGLGSLVMDPHAGSGRLYVVDGNEIRGVILGSSASVYTLAGAFESGQSDGNGGQASFYGPGGLAAVADADGPGTTSVFISDTENGLLRRMDIRNPLTATNSGNVNLTVTTLAGQPSHRGNADGTGTGADYSGTSTASFSQPEGIVTDGKIAYVADSENGGIRKIDLSTGQVTTVAGLHQGYGDGAAGGAAFYQNAGLSWLPNLNVIYIADAGNGVIRKLDLTKGTVSTVAGSNLAVGTQDGPAASATFNHPFGVLASPDGTKLYVADTGNNTIRMVDLTTNMVSTLAGHWIGYRDGIGTDAQFAEPNGLAFDASGNNIFISDFENQEIREMNLTTLAVTTVVGKGPNSCGDQDGPAATATLCTPAFLTSDGRSLFWGDANTGLLRVLNLSTHVVSTLAGSPGVMHMKDGDFTEAPGELTGPVRYNGVFGLAVAPDDSFILFTDKTANVVRIVH